MPLGRNKRTHHRLLTSGQGGGRRGKANAGTGLGYISDRYAITNKVDLDGLEVATIRIDGVCCSRCRGNAGDCQITQNADTQRTIA